MPSWTRKNGSAMPRNSAASRIMRISLNPSSSATESREATARPPGELRWAERAVPDSGDAADTFSSRRAFACADKPKRFRPSAKGLVRRRRFRLRDSFAVLLGSDGRFADALIARGQRYDFCVLCPRAQRTAEPGGDRGHACPLGERHQRQIDAQPAFKRKTQF